MRDFGRSTPANPDFPGETAGPASRRLSSSTCDPVSLLPPSTGSQGLAFPPRASPTPRLRAVNARPLGSRVAARPPPNGLYLGKTSALYLILGPVIERVCSTMTLLTSKTCQRYGFRDGWFTKIDFASGRQSTLAAIHIDAPRSLSNYLLSTGMTPVCLYMISSLSSETTFILLATTLSAAAHRAAGNDCEYSTIGIASSLARGAWLRAEQSDLHHRRRRRDPAQP